MKQLAGMDAIFLQAEQTTSTGHVGSISILDPSEMDRPFDLEHYTTLLHERLARIPTFRRRLREVPLGLDLPYWIDDIDFDLEFHVREIALPAPGDHAQLMTQVARLHARPLDLSHPLWEAYLISGLQNGKIGIYTKIHHAMIDGLAGVELLTALIDLKPRMPDDSEVPPFVPRPEPSSWSLFGRGLLALARKPIDSARIAANIVRLSPQLARSAAPYLSKSTATVDGAVIPTTVGRPPETPFNGKIGAHRRMGTCQADLADVRTIKTVYGTSVNDVVLAASAGALRRWLEDRGSLPDDPLVTMIPVSVRSGEGPQQFGNAVTSMFTPLPTNIKDPVRRLKACNAITKQAKEANAAIPIGLMEEVTHFAPPALMHRAARVAYNSGLMRSSTPCNIVISNVPGPDIQAYMGGAKLEAIYPMSVLVDGQGLNITIQGYRGKLNFGLIADRDMVPDVERLARYIGEEIDILHAAAQKAAAEPELATPENDSGAPEDKTVAVKKAAPKKKAAPAKKAASAAEPDASSGRAG